MEQNHPHDPITLAWLTNYTAFVCQRFGLPYDHGLLQTYLDLTAKDMSQPEMAPNGHHVTYLQEQPSIYSASSDMYHKTRNEGETAGSFDSAVFNSNTLTPFDAMPQGQVSPYYQQSDSNMMIDSSFSEASTQSLQRSQTTMPTYNGKYVGYDPLWAQTNDETILRVQKIKTKMKFAEIFSGRVVKINDVLTFKVSVLENGEDIETEAHLKVTRQFPSLSG